MPSATRERHRLTEEQKQHFLKHGFVKLENCFSRETAAEYTRSVWTRIGASQDDPSSWPWERANLPGHTTVDVVDFAPKAYDAICEIVGGEDRVEEWAKKWKDAWIVNLGKPEYKETDEPDFRYLDNWHNDGDWFKHFLDSGEQALLVIPLFSDIEPRGGGTVICTDGIGLVAKHMYNHPDGTTPFLAPWGTEDPPTVEQRRALWNSWVRDPKLTRDSSFHEVTGKIGDVYLLHPFMLHSASKNLRRAVRIITNPAVSIKEPFNFNRADPNEYSLVGQKTLRDLGRPEGIPEWKITAKREMKNPKRLDWQDDTKLKEVERLQKAGIPITTLKGVKVLDQTVYSPS